MNVRNLGACVMGGLLCFAIACERESRPFRDLPVAAARGQTESQTPLYAGAPSPPMSGTLSPYQENAWGISEGRRLYSAYNCVGCHANGGGAIGPALMDDEWIYGWEPANVYSTILEGRPNGMPSFRNKIPDSQVWQLVAYVQSMSSQTPIDATGTRADHMRVRRTDTQLPFSGRRQTGHK
jgi:cytochrome c oxidase cbb3-type subunit III